MNKRNDLELFNISKHLCQDTSGKYKRKYQKGKNCMNLVGKKTLLRAVELEDMDLFREMINDPEIRRFVVGRNFPVSKEAQTEWYKKQLIDRQDLRLTIVDLSNNCPIGMVSLTEIDWINRTAVSGIKLNSKNVRGKGYGTDAHILLNQYAFIEMNLHRLNNSIMSYNAASIKMCRKIGWVHEGTLRKAIFKDGSYHDLLIGGWLKNDFFEAIKALGYDEN
jgi:RimJ/RimL family protein N-acetyltransferase